MPPADTALAESSITALATVIIEPNSLFRASLAAMLEGSQFRTIASHDSLSQLLNPVLRKACVALVGLGQDAAAELTRLAALMQQHPGLRVFVLGERFS